MIEYKQRSVLKLTVTVFVILAAIIVIASVYNSKKSSPITPAITSTAAESNSAAKMEAPNNGQLQPPIQQPASPNDVQVQSVPPKEAIRKIQLQDIVRLRRTWGPILTAWYGEDAPDFTLTDITGKEHKLSDYRGKNVMVLFWATWCGPCVSEIPSLITLRSITGEDKLVILAISNESPNRVKRFVTDRKINYTVFSYRHTQHVEAL